MTDINKIFKEMDEKIRNSISESLQKSTQHAESELSRLFATEGASLAVKWSALKEAYLRYKIKKGYSEKILHRTTTLAQSFTSVVYPFEAWVGTAISYAVFHEKGGKRLPSRPFMKPVFEYILSERIPEKYFKEAMNV